MHKTEAYPFKPCKYCGRRSHYSFQCYNNPKRKQIKSGKQQKQWIITRTTWIRQNPPDYRGYWECYLQISPNCPRLLDKQSLTLDHIEARSRRPDLRYVQGNLQPACYWCNAMKGSKKIDNI